jgi:putative nucleotidyltransferase with HDIG domain
MSTNVENLDLVSFYQLLPDLTPTLKTMRSMSRAIENSSSGDMTAKATVYPFWGSFKRFTEERLKALAITPIVWYACVLGASAATTAALLILVDRPSSSPPYWLLAALCATALLAERQSVRISANTEMSITALPVLFAAIAIGPLAAMVVASAALVMEFRRPYTRWVIWTSSRALSGGAAGVAVALAPLELSTFGGVVAAVFLAAIVEAVLDVAFNALTVTLRNSGSFSETMRAMSRLLLSTVPLYTPVVAALAYAYATLSPWSVVLFFVPALAAQRLLVLYQEQRNLARDLGAANLRLERANFSFATALVTALDARDRYTAGHSVAVAVYARDIAAQLGLHPQEQALAYLCGLIHDIGKVGVPAGVLQKTGPLTVEERRQIEEHVIIGERILTNVEDYTEIAQIVRSHHERIDGNGYPDGLPGHKIPVLSRIIAVADAYNAMTSGRPYRDAMSSEIACARLRNAAGSQFDPIVVSAFGEILESGTEAYRRGARPDFALDAQRHPALTAVPAIAVV